MENKFRKLDLIGERLTKEQMKNIGGGVENPICDSLHGPGSFYVQCYNNGLPDGGFSVSSCGADLGGGGDCAGYFGNECLVSYGCNSYACA